LLAPEQKPKSNAEALKDTSEEAGVQLSEEKSKYKYTMLVTSRIQDKMIAYV
jgi:hypothetical protein